MQLKLNFQCHNLTSSEQALKKTKCNYFTCKSSLLYTRNSESSRFLGLENDTFHQRSIFPKNRHEKKFIQKHVLDITSVNEFLKNSMHRGVKTEKSNDFCHAHCLHKVLHSYTTVGEELWKWTRCCFP